MNSNYVVWTIDKKFSFVYYASNKSWMRSRYFLLVSRMRRAVLRTINNTAHGAALCSSGVVRKFVGGGFNKFG